MKTKKLIVSTLLISSVLFTTGCAGKFQKGNFKNFVFEKFDTNEDQKLSKEEHLELTLNRFEKVDDNEDGKITNDELKECHFFAKKMKKYDLDNDGTILKGELIEQTKKEFMQLDKNKDGFITITEYKG